MTTFDTNRAGSNPIANTFFTATFGAGSNGYTDNTAGFFMTVFGTLRTWNDARVTRKSLGKLTARELDDIGLCRGDIDAIATRSSRY